MSERPSFPPVYRPFAVTMEFDPFERGLVMAREESEPGTLLWSVGEDVFQWSVVLAPEQPLEDSSLVVLVAMLGLADALSSLIPPVVALTFGWPDRLEVNGPAVGGVRVAVAETRNPTEVPDWLVLGFSVASRGGRLAATENAAPGGTLEEAGCVVELPDLLESFSRHFLAWVNRWQSDGAGPVRQAWMSRASDLGREITLEVEGQTRRGVFKGLTDRGAIELMDAGRHLVVGLDRATVSPSWWG